MQYAYVLMRALPKDKQSLVDAAQSYAQMILEQVGDSPFPPLGQPENHKFSGGFVIPKVNRDWYMGPKAALIQRISQLLDVMVSYPLSQAVPGKEHNFVVHGSAAGVVDATNAFRVSQISLVSLLTTEKLL